MVAAELSGATGRPIEYVALAPEQHVTELVGIGVPRPGAESLRDLLAVICDHRSEYVSHGIQEVLGCEPHDLAAWAHATAATGAWTV